MSLKSKYAPLLLVCLIGLIYAPSAVAESLDYYKSEGLPYVRIIQIGTPWLPSLILDEQALTIQEIESYREDLAYILGVEELFAVPLGDRPPLNPVITGVTQGDGYVVWNLYFESLPGFPVSVNLYLPGDPTDPGYTPRPAVICPHGHWEWPGGRFDPAVQVRSIGLVKQGYAVLAHDAVGSGERDRDGIMEGHEELSAAQAYVGGPHSMGMQAYDISRAIDYLATLDDLVDLTHLAVTGESGGGSQTIYSAIYDDRIEVIVPVVYAGAGSAHPFGTGDESLPWFGYYMDSHILFALTYPAKVLYLEDSDYGLWITTTAENTYFELGAADYFGSEALESGHNYTRPYREWMYAWLSRWVLDVNVGDTLPDPPGVSDEMTLHTEQELTVGLPAWRMSFLATSSQLRADLPGHELPTSLAAWEDLWLTMKNSLAALMNTPAEDDPIDVEETPGSNPEPIRILPEDMTMEIWKDQSYFWDSWLDATLYKPAGPTPWPCVLLLNPNEFPEGDPAYEAVAVTIDDGPLIAQLVAEGYAVLKMSGRFNTIPDSFPRDERDMRWEVAVSRLLNYKGLPLFGRNRHDLSVAVSYLKTRSEILDDRISVWGIGEGGAISMIGGALDQRVCQVVTQASRNSYSVSENDRHPIWSYPPKFLYTADAPQVASMIAPRSLLVIDAVDDVRDPLSSLETAAELDWTLQAYSAFLASSQMQILTGAGQETWVASLDPQCGPIDGCPAGYLCLGVYFQGIDGRDIEGCPVSFTVDLLSESFSLVQRYENVMRLADKTALIDLTATSWVPSGDYYIVLRHYNHLDVITEQPVYLDVSGRNDRVDFTNPANIECGESSLVWIGEDWALPAGDIDPDNRIALSDFNYLRNNWTEADFACDLDCDGYCRLGDLILLHQNWNLQGCVP